MDARPDPAAPTAGALRFEQGVVAIALLAGFVFRVVWVVPVLAVVLLAALAGGERANALGRIHDALFTGPPAEERAAEPPRTTRMTRGVEVALLCLGSVFALLGVHALAWVFALPVAAITAIAATTGINVVARLMNRRRR